MHNTDHINVHIGNTVRPQNRSWNVKLTLWSLRKIEKQTDSYKFYFVNKFVSCVSFIKFNKNVMKIRAIGGALGEGDETGWVQQKFKLIITINN